MSNVKVKLRYKNYDGQLDNGNGIVVFDPTNKDIHVGGDEMYPVFTPSTSSLAGKKGLVPAPTSGDNNRFLNAAGQWVPIELSSFEVYPTIGDIPTPYKTNVIYLIGPSGSASMADRYEEYVYYNNDLTKIGETTIDLSNYALSTDIHDGVLSIIKGGTTTTFSANQVGNAQVDVDPTWDEWPS